MSCLLTLLHGSCPLQRLVMVLFLDFCEEMPYELEGTLLSPYLIQRPPLFKKTDDSFQRFTDSPYCLPFALYFFPFEDGHMDQFLHALLLPIQDLQFTRDLSVKFLDSLTVFTICPFHSDTLLSDMAGPHDSCASPGKAIKSIHGSIIQVDFMREFHEVFLSPGRFGPGSALLGTYPLFFGCALFVHPTKENTV